MPLQLKIVSENAAIVGDDSVREFNEGGGTIGRSLQNDWILPDPDRYISGRHATIDFKGGTYYLADTSSNGVYVNDEKDPIGKGNPRRLFDGDHLRMGDFQFAVSVDSGESLVMPLDEKASVAPDNIEQFVDEVSLKTGVKLLDEEEITGDEAFQSALFGSAPKATEPEALFEPAPVELSDRLEIIDEPVAKKPTSQPLKESDSDLIKAFLDGLGINPAEIHPTVNQQDMLRTAGIALRQCISGMSDLLIGRANLKNTFRLDQTTVLPRHNNPMKLSDNTTDLLKQLLVGGEGDYLGAEDSIREVSRDLINHQNAFLDAMNSAFIDFAERFDPEELQESFDRTMTGGKMLGFMNKSKYWDLYKDLYPIITEKGGNNRFPQMFGEEFVNAYERHVAKYQRHDRDGTVPGVHKTLDPNTIDPGLLATQKLDAPPAFEPQAAADEALHTLSDTAAADIDQSFIDELDNSMAEEVRQDQLKA